MFLSIARADFDPIPLAPGSFNQDMIIERGVPVPVQLLVTANMDAGTNIAGLVGGTGGNHGAFYEIGFGGTAGTGLPIHGTIFTAISNSTHQFLMAPDYRTNNAIFVGTYGTTGVQVDSGKLVPATPAAYSHLSFLAGAGGTTVISVQVDYQDGNVNVFQVSLVDWWTTNNTSTASTAWIANGSFQGTDGSFQRVNTTPQNARLFFYDFPLDFPSTPITNFVVSFVNGGRAALFAVSGSTDGGATFKPIPVSGFNQDLILEAPLAYSVTASMDAGLLSANNRGDNNVWFEQGFNHIDVARPWTGLPHPGATFNAWSNANHVFQMPPSYTTNCAVMINNQVTTGSLSLSTPTALNALSILGSSGSGPVNINLKINYQDGSSETTNFLCLDWFANQSFSTNWNVAFSAGGRVALGRRTVINNSGTLVSASQLLFNDFALANVSSPVTSVDFSYVSGGRAAIFALSGSTDNTAFNPLTVTGFNQDMVVEAAAITNMSLRPFVTSTMDGGTNRNGNSWHEMGYDPLAPNSGLPAPGSIITSTNLPDHRYQFASSYSAPNAVYCDSNNPVATIVFATPTNYSAVSFLSATANQGVQVQVILNHDDGTKETNVFNARDWFNNTPAAFTSNGRANADTRAVNNWLPGTTNPRLYEAQFQLKDTLHNVTGATLVWTTNNGAGALSSASSRFAVLAVSGVLGAAPPILVSSPGSLMLMEGSNAVLSATLSGGTPPITYKWERFNGSIWTLIADGGVFSGATTTNLTFTNINWTNSGDYRFIASNSGGSVTSSVATLTAYTSLPDVTQPSDPIVMYNGTSTAGESVAHVIDNVGQKYLNFGLNGAVPYLGPVGFIVTPTLGNTVVSAIRVYPANDSTQRDPADFLLEGSNNGGTTWIPIASGALNLSTSRNLGGTAPVLIGPPFTNFVQEVHFPNTAAYASYRWSVNNVRDNATANSMQVAEVELLGLGVGTPPAILTQPAPAVKVYDGASPTFSVGAFGFPTNLAYQWYLNGTTPIVGATAATYTLNNVQAGDSGKSFHCIITNSAGSITSAASTLTVVPKPTAGYALAILADQPLAFWRLNEPDNGLGSGNAGMVASDYWGGHNGVYTNALLSQPGYVAHPADADTACQFGAYGNDGFVGAISGIDFAQPAGQNASFSIEAWVKGEAQAFDAGIVNKGFGGGEQFCLDTGANRRRNAWDAVLCAERQRHGLFRQYRHQRLGRQLASSCWRLRRNQRSAYPVCRRTRQFSSGIHSGQRVARFLQSRGDWLSASQ